MGIEEDELIDDEEADEFNFVAIGIIAVLLLAIVGGLIWYFLIREPPSEEDGEPRLPQWEAPADLTPELVYDGLERMIINPIDSRGRYFLVVKIDIAFNRDVRGELLSKPWAIPQTKNVIIDVLSDFTVSELQAPDLKEEARMEIKRELNRLLGWEGDELTPEELEELDDDDKPPIRDIYFVEFILN